MPDITINQTVTSLSPNLQYYLDNLSKGLAKCDGTIASYNTIVCPAYLTLHEDDSDQITDIGFRDYGKYIGGANLFTDYNIAGKPLEGNRLPDEVIYSYDEATKTHTFDIGVEFGSSKCNGTINRIRLWNRTGNLYTTNPDPVEERPYINGFNINPVDDITYRKGLPLPNIKKEHAYTYSSRDFYLLRHKIKNNKFAIASSTYDGSSSSDNYMKFNLYERAVPELGAPLAGYKVDGKLLGSVTSIFTAHFFTPSMGYDIDNEGNLYLVSTYSQNKMRIHKYDYNADTGYSETPTEYVITLNFTANSDGTIPRFHFHPNKIGCSCLGDGVVVIGYTANIPYDNANNVYSFVRYDTKTSEVIEQSIIPCPYPLPAHMKTFSIGYDANLDMYTVLGTNTNYTTGKDYFCFGLSNNTNLSTKDRFCMLGSMLLMGSGYRPQDNSLESLFNGELTYVRVTGPGLDSDESSVTDASVAVDHENMLSHIITKRGIFSYPLVYMNNGLLADIKIDPINKTEETYLKINIKLNIKETFEASA